MHCGVHEGNQGAYLLATNQRVPPRTKYSNTKYHSSWSHVKPGDNPGGPPQIVKCPTTEQQAGYLTKGLVRGLFGGNRKSAQGWWGYILHGDTYYILRRDDELCSIENVNDDFAGKRRRVRMCTTGIHMHDWNKLNDPGPSRNGFDIWFSRHMMGVLLNLGINNIC